MMTEWIILFAGATTLSAIGFVCVAVIWLRKLRETLSLALTESAEQRERTTQHLTKSLRQVQSQQDSTTRQIQVLAQAGIRLQQELTSVTNRLDSTQTQISSPPRTLH